MFDLFAKSEKNLGRAGWLLIFEISFGVAIGLAIDSEQRWTHWIFAAVWVINLLTAWYISRAALALGKSPVVFGVVAALVPAAAFACWSYLYLQDIWRRIERGGSGTGSGA